MSHLGSLGHDVQHHMSGDRCTVLKVLCQRELLKGLGVHQHYPSIIQAELTCIRSVTLTSRLNNINGVNLSNADDSLSYANLAWFTVGNRLNAVESNFKLCPSFKMSLLFLKVRNQCASPLQSLHLDGRIPAAHPSPIGPSVWC